MKFLWTLESTGGNNAAFVVPDEVVEELGGGGRPKVAVTVNGFAFRSSIARMGGRYLLGVNAERRESAGIAPGDEVEIALDTAPREIDTPPDLAEALAPHPTPTRSRSGTACPSARSSGTCSRSRAPRPPTPAPVASPSPSTSSSPAAPAELPRWGRRRCIERSVDRVGREFEGAGRPRGAGQPAIERGQCNAERLGERDVPGVVTREVVAQLPDP